MVVDVQRGFVGPRTGQVAPVVAAVTRRWLAAERGPVYFTTFHNQAHSPFAQFLDWHKVAGPPGDDLVPELADLVDHTAVTVVPKGGYSAAAEVAACPGWPDPAAVYVCGLETDSCVTATAFGLFDRGCQPVLVADACATHAGPEVHMAALRAARRNFGRIVHATDMW